MEKLNQSDCSVIGEIRGRMMFEILISNIHLNIGDYTEYWRSTGIMGIHGVVNKRIMFIRYYTNKIYGKNN